VGSESFVKIFKKFNVDTLVINDRDNLLRFLKRSRKIIRIVLIEKEYYDRFRKEIESYQLENPFPIIVSLD